MESIRYNAPLTFISQNRAVTASDYRSLILRDYGDIEAITTWGGEDNDPKEFGKVFVSIKPRSGETLTENAKGIITNLLEGKNVVSITPEFVDPDFTDLHLEVFFKYNPNLTDSTIAEIEAVVRQTIVEYNLTELRQFDGVFRHSKLLKAIDDSNSGILSSTVRIYMNKTLDLIAGTNNPKIVNFSVPIYRGYSEESVIVSDSFLINADTCFIGDEVVTGDSTIRNLYIYKLDGTTEVKVVDDIGTMTLETGVLSFNTNLVSSEVKTINIRVLPNSLDIAPKRNVLIDISITDTTIVGEVDSIAVAGTSGAIDYTTISRQ